MAIVHIPSALRGLTQGETQAKVEGATLREVIANLEAAYPGVQARLTEGERLRPGLAVFVDGASVRPLLSARIPESAELYFVPAIAGGAPR